jgi:hypothetical protein
MSLMRTTNVRWATLMGSNVQVRWKNYVMLLTSKSKYDTIMFYIVCIDDSTERLYMQLSSLSSKIFRFSRNKHK